MTQRYDRLADEAVVCRMVKYPGSYWPREQPLPTPAMLQPTRDDIEQGQRAGRGPGVSVFESSRFDLEIACWVRSDRVYAERRDWTHCSANVKDLRSLNPPPFGHRLDVVFDPLDDDGRSLEQRWQPERVRALRESHALIEGIAAAPAKIKGESGKQRADKLKAYQDALQRVRDVFRR
jgi:hypothetical protein